MTIEKLEGLLQAEEGFTVEYKECFNVLNNPNNIHPSLFLNLETIEYKGMIVLWV